MEIEKQIVDYLTIVAQKRGRPASALEPNVSFMDAGILDSLSLLDFVSFLEKSLGIQIPGNDIVPENFGNLAAVTKYARERLEGGDGR